MQEEKRHVGRPTNEEVKIRRNKKILKILIPVLIFVVAIVGIIAFQNTGVNKLGGAINSYGGALYVSASNSKTRQSGCNIVIPLTIKNTADYSVTVNKIGLKYYGSGNKWIQQDNVNWQLSKKQSVTKDLTYDLKKIDASVSMLTIIIYFNNGNNYTTENLKIGNMWYERIKACKTTTTQAATTKKATTAQKSGLTINCPTEAKVNQQFTCKTNMSGVKISVTGTNLASGYNTSFTTTAKDMTKQSKYTKAGVVTVIASKSGYASVSTKVNVGNVATTKATTKAATTKKATTNYTKESVSISYKINGVERTSSDYKTFYIVPTAIGSHVKSASFTVCATKTDCENLDTSKPKTGNGGPTLLTSTGTLSKGKEVKYKAGIKVGPGNHTYYMKITTYGASGNVLARYLNAITMNGSDTSKKEWNNYKDRRYEVKNITPANAKFFVSLNNTTTKAANTKKASLNGSCEFTGVSSYVSNGLHYVKYSTKCTGNAKVTNIAYKTPYISGFENRGDGWGSKKGETSTINFASSNAGKKVTLRLYYDTVTNSKSTANYKDYSVTVK